MAFVRLSLLAIAASGDQVPQDVADAFGAKCLNGDAPQYQIIRHEDSTKWVLFLAGGGWCYGPTENETIQSCATRAGFVWPPSSQPAPHVATDDFLVRSTADKGGVMSEDPSENPDFYSWNKVYFSYCDGGSFASNRDEPIPVSTSDGQPANMWLRGRRNFDATIYHLMNSLGMTEATEVILSGGSAGGLAVLYNLDHLATLLSPQTKLTGFPDAGFFLDEVSVAGTFDYRQQFLGADGVWNLTKGGGTNLKCLASHAGEEWKCLMAPYIVEHIETNLYVMNSAYDIFQLEHILEAECFPDPSKAPCSAEQNVTLQGYYDKFLRAVSKVTEGKPKNGVYIDSCYVHEQNVNYCSDQGVPNCVGWSPSESGSKKWGYTTSVVAADGRTFTPQEAFSAYYRGDQSAFIIVDQLRYPNNPSCQYLGHPVSGPLSV